MSTQAAAQLRAATIYYLLTQEIEINGSDVISPITGEVYYLCYEGIDQPQHAFEQLQSKIVANRRRPSYRLAFIERQDWFQCYLSPQEQTAARQLVADTENPPLDRPDLMLQHIMDFVARNASN